MYNSKNKNDSSVHSVRCKTIILNLETKRLKACPVFVNGVQLAPGAVGWEAMPGNENLKVPTKSPLRL